VDYFGHPVLRPCGAVAKATFKLTPVLLYFGHPVLRPCGAVAEATFNPAILLDCRTGGTYAEFSQSDQKRAPNGALF